MTHGSLGNSLKKGGEQPGKRGGGSHYACHRVHVKFTIKGGSRGGGRNEKRNECDFPIVNFPYLNSNIPEFSAYAVLI